MCSRARQAKSSSVLRDNTEPEIPLSIGTYCKLCLTVRSTIFLHLALARRFEPGLDFARPLQTNCRSSVRGQAMKAFASLLDMRDLALPLHWEQDALSWI